jgi:hypothetical protein
LLIIFLELKIFNYYSLENNKNIKDLQELESILILDQVVSDSNYLAKSTQIVYKNNIDLKNLNKLKAYSTIANLKIDNKIIYTNKKNKEINNCYNRGVVYNNKFSILEMCFYE